MIRRTELREEIRKMRFDEAYDGWTHKRLTQVEAARLLGICERTFRRYIHRYDEDNIEGLLDQRLHQISGRRAPVDEVMALKKLYSEGFQGWNVKHFYSFYKREHKGIRGYTWVKKTLQEGGLVPKNKKRGAHRKKRERAVMRGMMLHQDGSTHEWVPGQYWDLIITLDDATSEHYSMFFVEEEGTSSSFQGVQEVIEKQGLFCSLYTDRGSHYWHTPEVNGPVDKQHFTQFRRGLHQLGIEMIAAYSPEARGRCERMFGTHQERLVKELAAKKITTMSEANGYLKTTYMAAFNAEFTVKPIETGKAFVPWVGGPLVDILCEHYERTVGKNNCVSFEGLSLQIPANQYRCNYVKVKVRVHRYQNGECAIFHGPRKLADYDVYGKIKEVMKNAAA